MLTDFLYQNPSADTNSPDSKLICLQLLEAVSIIIIIVMLVILLTRPFPGPARGPERQLYVTLPLLLTPWLIPSES